MSSKIILVYVVLFVASSQSTNIPMLGWTLSDAVWGIVEYLFTPQLSGLPISTDEEYVNYEYEEYEPPEYLQ